MTKDEDLRHCEKFIKNMIKEKDSIIQEMDELRVTLGSIEYAIRIYSDRIRNLSDNQRVLK